MPDYKEETGTAKKWVRSNEVLIENPYQQTPRITYREQEVVEIGGSVFTKPYSTLDQAFAMLTDPNKTFPLRDPITDEPTGEVRTLAQLHQMIYSHYRAVATERDAAVEARAAAMQQSQPI